jgi:hypothetical protein
MSVLSDVMKEIEAGTSRWVPVWLNALPTKNAKYYADYSQYVHAENLKKGTPVYVVAGGTPVCIIEKKVYVITVPFNEGTWHTRVFDWIIKSEV